MITQTGKQWKLAALTSRQTWSSVRDCGDGGVYVLVAPFMEWVKSVPGGRWN